jgi:hypothetical protein
MAVYRNKSSLSSIRAFRELLPIHRKVDQNKKCGCFSCNMTAQPTSCVLLLYERRSDA